MPQGNRNEVNDTGLAGQLRRAWLAGMGAAATAREEVQDLVNRFVERGEQVEQEGRELVHGMIAERTNGLTERRKRVVQLLEQQGRGLTKNLTGRIESARTLTRDFAGELAEKLQVAVEQVLARMPLASRSDLVVLNNRLDRLSRKLDRLERK